MSPWNRLPSRRRVRGSRCRSVWLGPAWEILPEGSEIRSLRLWVAGQSNSILAVLSVPPHGRTEEGAAIPIPTFDRFIEPLLRLLAAHPDGTSAPQAQSALADQMGVTAEERRELLPSGAYPVYKSRIGWAHDRLKRDGLSTSVKRGCWQITEKGRRYAEANPRLSEAELLRLARPQSDVAIVDSAPGGLVPAPVGVSGSPSACRQSAMTVTARSVAKRSIGSSRPFTGAEQPRAFSLRRAASRKALVGPRRALGEPPSD